MRYVATRTWLFVGIIIIIIIIIVVVVVVIVVAAPVDPCKDVPDFPHFAFLSIYLPLSLQARTHARMHIRTNWYSVPWHPKNAISPFLFILLGIIYHFNNLQKFLSSLLTPTLEATPLTAQRNLICAVSTFRSSLVLPLQQRLYFSIILYSFNWTVPHIC
jgi:hypothetical protein